MAAPLSCTCTCRKNRAAPEGPQQRAHSASNASRKFHHFPALSRPRNAPPPQGARGVLPGAGSAGGGRGSLPGERTQETARNSAKIVGCACRA
eukprot:4119742-Alexandrium_andersonii.AAC.1